MTMFDYIIQSYFINKLMTYHGLTEVGDSDWSDLTFITKTIRAELKPNLAKLQQHYPRCQGFGG